MFGRSAEVELSPSVYKDGQVLDAVAFGKAVRTALKEQLPGAPRSVALSVGGQGVLVRRAGLPKLKPTPLRHLMETQGDLWIPFIREGALFDLTVINPDASEHQQEVLITAVPARIIGQVESLLKLAGLRLGAIDVDLSALYRATVAEGKAPAHGAVAVLDLNQDRPRLGLFHDGYLVGTRTLDPRFGRSVGAIGDDMSVEVRRAVELMLTPLRDETQLNALVVVAAGVEQELFQAIEREFALALRSRLAADFKVGSGLGPSVPTAMALAYGLALAEVQPPRSYNLLPRPTVTEGRQRLIAWALSVLLLLGLGAYGVLWTMEMPVLQAQQSAKRSQLAKLKTELAREPVVAAEEATAQGLRPLLDQMSKNGPWSVAQPQLKALLPTGVRLQTISVAAPTLTIKGSAENPEQVAALLNALHTSSYFHSPVLTSSGVGEGYVDFNLTVELARREVKGP